MAPTTVHFKAFSTDPRFLEECGDRILAAFAPNCRVSRVMPTDKGDFHIFVTIYKEEGPNNVR